MRTLLSLLVFLVAAPCRAQVPTPTTVRALEMVYVLFGGNPASATPRPLLTHSYGEVLTVSTNEKVATVNATWTRASFGHVLAVAGATYGYITIPLDAPAPGGQCSQNQVQQAADKLIPPVAGSWSFPIGGVPVPPAPGALPTSRWYFVPAGVYCGNSDGSFPFGMFEHEFGHDFGLLHEHDTLQNGTVYTTEEYGTQSVMGQGGVNIGAEMKAHGPNGGFFDATLYRLLTVTTPQDVVLTNINAMTPGIKALKAGAFFAEFRVGGQGGPNEVLIHNSQDSLLDLDPGPGVKWSLDPGETRCFPGVTPVCFTNQGWTVTTATIHVGFDPNTAPPPPPPPPPAVPLTVQVLSPANGVSVPLSQTNATTGLGLQAIVQATGAASVIAHFGPSGATSTFTCGAAATPYYACSISGTTYTFTLKTAFAAGTRVLSFDAVSADGHILTTPQQTVVVTP